MNYIVEVTVVGFPLYNSFLSLRKMEYPTAEIFPVKLVVILYGYIHLFISTKKRFQRE